MSDSTEVMQAFPASEHQQVTLANWRTPPYSRWAFHHVREIVPSADIRHQPENIWQLQESLVNLGGLNIDCDAMGVMSLAGYINYTNVDAMIVLHRDQIVFEQYNHGMTRYHPHILMSVSKSVLGLLGGILEAQGLLDQNKPAAFYVPELKTTGYKTTSVRDLLDMRAGIDFDEDYLATHGAIIDYRKATGWNPLAEHEAPGDLRSFYQTLSHTKVPDGGAFNYVSPNTDLLAWVIERACGKNYADLLSEHLWQPMGAESSAYITVDRFGAPRAAGGVCSTLRDVARVGRLMANNGKRDDLQILPKDWTNDLVTKSDKKAWDQGNFADMLPNQPVSYRNKWYVCHPSPVDEAQWYMALGIHGQYIFVDAANEFVMVQFSSDPEPLPDKGALHSLVAARAIRDYLVNHF